MWDTILKGSNNRWILKGLKYDLFPWEMKVRIFNKVPLKCYKGKTKAIREVSEFGGSPEHILCEFCAYSWIKAQFFPSRAGVAWPL